MDNHKEVTYSKSGDKCRDIFTNEESCPTMHIKLKEFFKNEMKFFRNGIHRVDLPMKIKKNVSKRLTTYVSNRHAQSYSTATKEAEFSNYYIRGYRCAKLDDNPYLDEIKLTGPKFDITSPQLHDFLDGYLRSMRDDYYANFSLVGKNLNQKNIGAEGRYDEDSVGRNKLRQQIFISTEAYTECMHALRNVKNPIISNNNVYLLGSKQKGAFTAWYEVVKLKGKLKPRITAAKMSQFLNMEIEGLGLYPDGTTLHRKHTTMYIKYKSPLFKLIL